jgi:hypothetical protein
LQIHALNETGEIKNLDESERANLLGLSDPRSNTNDPLILTQENTQKPPENTIELANRNVQLISQQADKINVTQQVAVCKVEFYDIFLLNLSYRIPAAIVFQAK